MLKKNYKNKILVKSEKQLITICLNLFLILTIFDGIRESLSICRVVNIGISALRDGCFYLVVFYVFFNSSSEYNRFHAFVIVTTLLMPIIFYEPSKFYGEIPFEVSNLRNIQFFIISLKPFLFYVLLLNFNSIYCGTKLDLLKVIILTSLVMFFVSLLVYVFFPYLIVNKFFSNRIGLGNMSIQSGIYLISYILTLYYSPFKHKFFNIFIPIIFLIAIVTTVTSTGIVTAIFTNVLLIFDRKTRRRTMIVFFIALIMIIIFCVIFQDYLTLMIKLLFEKYDEFLDLLLNKLRYNSGHKTKSISFHAREKQIEVLKKNLSYSNIIFGFGYFSQLSDRELIENTYYSIIHDYGFYGLVVFFSIIIGNIFIAAKALFMDKNYFKIIVIGCYLLFATTLNITICLNLSISFILLFYFAFKVDGLFDR